jgi:pyruvate/2-oxoglutarate dehydrogenase complex dihydrolipoamide acyltransferase (E2) component
VTLTPEERAMLRTVAWHHAESVAGYVELHADPAPWLHYADAFQSAHGLLFSPLLSLMAWQVAQFARAQPRLNSVIVGERRYAYDDVNLGFTVQTESTLYLVVIRQADTLSPYDFCEQVTDLQRRATRNDLSEADVTGATIAFTSMARWNVTRHVPVLPPLTSIAIAHSAPRGQDLVLGATYDHRGLNGGDVAAALEQIARIPEPA